MNKAKTNALEALRALIAERQQYEQWIATLESKRESTPAHVFERVQSDYNARLERVLTNIKGHAEELQLSISALSSRLIEVARDEDTRRDDLSEAELRATVGEYEPERWEQLRKEAEQGLEAVAADRASLDGQLNELRSIQKLSEVGSKSSVSDVAIGSDREPVESAPPAESPVDGMAGISPAVGLASDSQGAAAPREQGHLPLDQVDAPQEPESVPQSAAPVAPAASPHQRTRTGKTPPFGSQVARPKPPESRVDQSKTLKCPECGTANYATEWYCERCGGELATM